MNRTLNASLVFAALLGAPAASAQDWSGGWYGISVGSASGTYQLGVSAKDELGPNVDVDGTSLSLRYGRNTQNGGVVYGFDVDVSNGPDGITPQGTKATGWACFSGDCNVSINTLISLRGRIGALLGPRSLAYAAGGLAIADVEGGIEDSDQQGSSTAVGYTVGFGLEQMVSDRMTVFAEANFVDLGTLDFGTDSIDATFDGLGDFTTVKLGVNFRF